MSFGSFGSAVSFCIVVVMNEGMVNGSRHEQQEIKSADSKTSDTGKYILNHFVSFYFNNLIRVLYLMLIMIHH